jgi:uncharacterized Zn finger protein
VIPRKEAQRLLEEFLARIVEADADAATDDLDGDPLGYDEMRDLLKKQLAESDLVLRGAENVEQKGRRYLTEGRICVEQIAPSGLVVGSARGSGGETYKLGYDPKAKQWRCTCRAGQKGRCSHLIGLRLVTAPTTGGTT